MLIGHIYDEVNHSNNNNEEKATTKNAFTKHSHFPLLPVMKTRTVTIQAQTFNKHSYTKGSPEHNFIC